MTEAQKPNQQQQEQQQQLGKINTPPNSNSTTTAANSNMNSNSKDQQKPEGGEVLYLSEGKEIGAVKFKHFVTYAAAIKPEPKGASLGIVIGFIFLFAIGQAGRTVGEWWLGQWADSDSISNKEGVSVYLYVTCVSLFISLLRTLAFSKAAVTAATKMHDEVVGIVLRAPVNLFYDVTPLGRILNRFSGDIDRMDLELPETLENVTQNIFRCSAALVVCVSSTYYFLPFLLPLGALFYFIYAAFRPTSRELKRLEGMSRSPILQHFGETLTGLSTIRAFRYVHRYREAFESLVDENCKCYLTFWTCGRWLGTRLDLISVITVLAVSLLAVSVRDDMNRAVVGLALVYAIQLTGLLQFTVRQSIEVEAHMVAVERLNQFRTVPSELNIDGTGGDENDGSDANAVEKKGAVRVPEDWPSRGEVSLEGVELRYRPGLPLVLKGLTARIPPGSKVGVCGRTGAGKSSVMVALLRLVELAGGALKIDGIDIAQVPLNVLRSRVSIIPQDPVLFSGTLRFNLDPFSERSDGDMWAALGEVDLKEKVMEEEQRLEAPVAERGENWSVGQRQLICIARALLRGCRLVLLDEATASVDAETDRLIQSTIRKNFKSLTVLTIAHRIQTIIDSDLVLVLGDGRVEEQGAPKVLLANPDSAFSSMVREHKKKNKTQKVA